MPEIKLGEIEDLLGKTLTFVYDGELDEINAYIARATEKYGSEPQKILINVCGDEVELEDEDIV